MKIDWDVPIVWRDYLERSRRIALGLASLGFARGDATAIIGDNRPELYWAVLATQALGGIPVPLYQDSIEKELVYILDHSEARFAVAEDQEQVDKLLNVRARCPRLEFIVYVDARGLRGYSEPGLLSLAELPGARREVCARAIRRTSTTRSRGGGAEDTAVICYTSGTTGTPKGAMLSHRNLIVTARSADRARGAAPRRRGRWPTCRWPGSATTCCPTRRPSWPGSPSTVRRAPPPSCTTSRRSGRPTSSRPRASGKIS